MAIESSRVAAQRYRQMGLWRDTTLVDDFRDVAARMPDKVAIVSDRNGQVRTVLSYRQLLRLSDRIAGALFDLGIRPGDVVSMQLPNWWQFAALTMATFRVGGIINPITPILRRHEVGFILERVGSRLCIVPDRFRGFNYGKMVAELAQEIPSLEHVFVIGDPVAGTENFDERFIRPRWEDLHSDAEFAALKQDSNRPAEIQFTSGTTGEPKGVVHSFNTMHAAVKAIPDPLGLDDGDVVFMASTLAHQTGFIYGMLMPLSLGMKVVYQDEWTPGRMLELIEDEGVTWTMGAAAFVLDALAAQKEKPRNTSTLRYFACAGAPIPPHLIAATRSVLGAQLVAIWGMTENGVVTMTRPEDPADFASVSDGRPVPWMELRIIDEDGHDVPHGTVGRLLVRGASQCIGYFKRPDLYAASLVDGDWFDTGDLARMDSTGAIRIAGRVRDLIIRGGENIPVVEIEGAIYHMPSVREVALVGVNDMRLGERACAVVVASGNPPTLEDVRVHLESLGIAKQFWPERLEILPELPKTPSGKVQKFKLRAQFGDERDRD